tara:strand:+ start:9886 stop:11463 length:1578 start_codon:yes stop_codon:yes gene_type:complete
MAIPFLSDIKLNGNQIKELVVDHKSGSNPSTGYHGQLIFRTDQNKVYINTSTNTSSPSWASIAGDITSITAGAGLTTPDGSTGDVTINAVGGDGITVGTDEIEVTVDDATLELNNNDGSGAVRIKDGGVVAAKIGTGAVETGKIADNAVTLAKLEHQANDTVLKMNGSGVPTAGKIDTINISADAVTGAKIGDDEINSEHIATGAIDLDHMSVNSVDSDQYVDGSIDTDHIADAQVTLAKIQHIATQKILGRNTTGTGDVESLSPSDFRPFLKTTLNGGFGSNALTIGDSDDTITIPGNLKVTGDTTYSNETIQIVTDNTLAFRAGDGDAHEILLTAANATGSDKTITLPNATGTVALTSNIGDATITITAGAGLVTGGDFTTNASSDKTITIDHEDTSSQASVDNSGLNVIQDVTLDTYGHVTGLASVDLQSGIDGRITNREFSGTLTPGGTSGQQGYVAKTSNTYTVYHALATRDVVCQVVQTGSPYATAQVDVERTSVNEVKVLFGQAVTNGDYRILITKIG